MKFLPKTFLENRGLLDQLDTEVRRSAQLAHPAISRVFHFLFDGHDAAIVTEYVDGWTLAALKLDRPQNRFQRDDINLWFHQLCAALDYAHHHFRLVHQDLNPSNLLLNSRDYLKVTDFAIDRAIRTGAAQTMNLSYGTIAYLSPQQLRGAEASVLDDIYALGATMYDLITGTPPFHKGELRSQILEAPAPSMKERLLELEADEEVPIEWEDMIAACLSKDPGKRPHSASDVLRGLHKTTPVGQIESPARCRRSFLRRIFEPLCNSARHWGLAARRRGGEFIRQVKPQADKMVDAFRRNPRLLLAAILSVAAVNLGLALWFLFRR